MSNNDLELYRKKKHMEYCKMQKEKQLKEKYASLIDLNKPRCAATRIVRFAKRHFFVEPLNLDSTEIKFIPPIYRFRCSVYIGDEMKEIDSIYNARLAALESEEDEIMKSIMKESAEIEWKNDILLAKQNMNKINIMLDLRIYGMDPNIPVYLGEDIIELDIDTKNKIKKSYYKVIPDSPSLERFEQLVDWSKCLSQVYAQIKQ